MIIHNKTKCLKPEKNQETCYQAMLPYKFTIPLIFENCDLRERFINLSLPYIYFICEKEHICNFITPTESSNPVEATLKNYYFVVLLKLCLLVICHTCCI